MSSHKELEAVLAEGLEKLQGLITHGATLGGKEVPPMDPLAGIDTLEKKVDIPRGEINFRLEKPQLTGLGKIQLQKPSVDLDRQSISLGFSFPLLAVESAQYTADGSFKLLFKHRVHKEGRFLIEAEGVTLELDLELQLQEEGPALIARDARVNIDDLDADIDDTIVLDFLIPFFRENLEEVIASQLKEVATDVLTDGLRSAYKAQQATFDSLVRLYKLKREQGLGTDEQGNPEKPAVLKGFGGFSQLPLPMFWVLPCVDTEHTPHHTLSEVCAKCKTGDLILFSGTKPGSQGIRRATQSQFSHVTVVVKDPSLLNGEALLFQATDSAHKCVLRNDEMHPGVQLNRVTDYVHDYWHGVPDADIVWRQLDITERDPEEEKAAHARVLDFVHRLDGTPYTNDMAGLYIMGLMEIDNPNENDWFCAGIVAQALVEYGILKDVFKHYQYGPGDFSAAKEVLPYVNAANRLGQEFVIDRD